jgi:hypothetical protein
MANTILFKWMFAWYSWSCQLFLVVIDGIGLTFNLKYLYLVKINQSMMTFSMYYVKLMCEYSRIRYITLTPLILYNLILSLYQSVSLRTSSISHNQDIFMSGEWCGGFIHSSWRFTIQSSLQLISNELQFKLNVLVYIWLQNIFSTHKAT